MKFLDANGLARFTQKLFSKFISGVTGENNVITVTKGDGTKNTIDLNAVQKTDTLSKDPPDDDNSQKIATTSWVQKLVAVMVFKLIAKLAGTTETGVSSSGSFLGVHWLIAQNGYIAFGPLFGNLILQWGLSGITTTAGTFTQKLPISFVEQAFQAVASWDNPMNDVEWNTIPSFIFAIKPNLNNVVIARNNTSAGNKSFRYLAIGR